MFFTSIDQIINDARKGKMFILLDSADRENEGDLVIPAQFITVDIMNFMVTHARGVPCMPISQDIADKLELKLQDRRGVDDEYIKFTTSIEAVDGISTGTSIHDRVTTILAAVNPKNSYKDIKTPGHVYPVIANSEGVFARQGHTEASIEVMKLANLMPAAVLCEILHEDGNMAHRDDIFVFAKEYDLNVTTIDMLMEYLNIAKAENSVKTSESVSTMEIKQSIIL